MKEQIGSMSPNIIKKIYRLIRYRNEYPKTVRERKYRKVQDTLLREQYDPNSGKLIVFIVPGSNPVTGKDTISGGVISIVSICEETKKMKEIHGANVIMCTVNEDSLLLKHENFENNTPVFRFGQIPRYFGKATEILIHVPEFMVSTFATSLSKKDLQWLAGMKLVHVNIMNQNIRLMPDPTVIATLGDFAGKLTITTAHQKYCTPHYRQHFGIPIHKLSVWISPEQYVNTAWNQKENLLVVSPDPNPEKEQILTMLQGIPGLTIQVIGGLTYEQYKALISRAKWSLTFGEGLDGYLIEPVFSGAIGFAIYNEQFFTPDFGALRTVYKSLEELKSKIRDDIKLLDGTPEGIGYQKQQYDLCAYYYSKETYRKNIAAFYRAEYTHA